jgi:hypothetical protein
MTAPSTDHTTPAHRVTYYTQRLERVETGRYTDRQGNQIVLESAHAALASVTNWPARHAGGFGVHHAVDAQGATGYVVKVAHAEGQLLPIQWQQGEHTMVHYCPRDEWGTGHCGFFATVADALVYAGDSTALAAEHDRIAEMTALADVAAAAVDGDANQAWSRDAYVAACAAAGVDPADDVLVTRLAKPGGGVYGVPEYHREHVVWAQLAYRRAAGIESDTARAEIDALARADQAAAADTYSRDQYAAACAAAGVTTLPDQTVLGIAWYEQAEQDPVRDVLAEVQVAELLGTTPRTAATLAARRRRGIDTELSARRASERLTLQRQGHDFAAATQVDQIMRLLAQRAHRGERGGFFAGPTDPGGVANLSKADASSYITSLTGDY